MQFNDILQFDLGCPSIPNNTRACKRISLMFVYTRKLVAKIPGLFFYY